MAPAKTLPVVELPCGCFVEIESHGGKRVVGKCREAEALFAETKRAGKESHDPRVKGASKVKLCREFDLRRSAFRAHVGLGTR